MFEIQIFKTKNSSAFNVVLNFDNLNFGFV